MATGLLGESKRATRLPERSYWADGSNGLCFEVANKSLSSGAAIVQDTRNGLDSQKFFIERMTADSYSGKYRIRAKMSSLYVTVTGAATSSGAGLTQTAWTGGAEQQWWLTTLASIVQTASGGNSPGQMSRGQVGGTGGNYPTDQMWRVLTAQ